MNIHNSDELIHELSGLCGILPEYWDIFGKKHVTQIKTMKAVLRAMKLRIDSNDDILGEIAEKKSQPWKNIIEPVHVFSVSAQPVSVPLFMPINEREEAGLVVSWSLKNEEGEGTGARISGVSLNVIEDSWIDGLRYIRTSLQVSHSGIGYYLLEVDCRHRARIFPGGRNRLHKVSRIIVTPDSCYVPPELKNRRAWGLSINLYSVRSARNCGSGDFTDLGKIVKWVSDLKGSFVGINPLHAIPNAKPFGVSPYAPISRLYRNFIYIDIEKIPEVAESGELRKIISSGRYKKQVEALRKQHFIDYEKVALLKEKILRKAFEIFRQIHYETNTIRGREFRKFVIAEAAALESFSLFMALRDYMKKKKLFAWQEWPREYHDISGQAVDKFRKKHASEILFHKYVQWLLNVQLQEIADDVKKLGMGIGLYNDLAVGSVGGGSDVWSYQEVFSCGSDVGAPPDDFSPHGQQWGFPPAIPEKLRESGYELFIQTIRKNMKHAGALRIDHALGLFRLFWIPNGMTPKEGAYVSFPSEDLLRIIALESVRNRTLVIAEDLGTIGENVRKALSRFRMFSYRLFYFERNYPDPSFLSPEKYPEMALCAVTTHDLPTLSGYWTGRDIEVRRETGKHPDNEQCLQQTRERDKSLILAALKSEGVLPDEYPFDTAMSSEMTPELCVAIYEYLARTPCRLMLVSLDDIIGSLNQQNLPGTIDSHPNWIQKTTLTLEDILEDNRFCELSRMLSREGYFR
jgi:4-alpha-glucanotransferase